MQTLVDAASAKTQADGKDKAKAPSGASPAVAGGRTGEEVDVPGLFMHRRELVKTHREIVLPFRVAGRYLETYRSRDHCRK